MKHLSYISVHFFVIVTACCAQAQYCSKITDSNQLALLDSVIACYRVDSCCEGIIAECIKSKPACSIAPRLMNFACFLTFLGHKPADLVKELDKRQAFLFDSTTEAIDITLLPPAGSSDAPIAIAAYVNASCPRCKMVTIPLYNAVTSGVLKSKAKLYVIPFSVQSGNAAYLASAQMGKFWEYYRDLAVIRERLNEDILLTRAEYIGIPRSEFQEAMDNKDVIKRLKQNYQHAKKLGIAYTPTVFINSRRYTSHTDPEWVIDAALFEYEKRESKHK